MEGVTVTKHGERLIASNPQVRRTFIRSVIAQAAVFAVCFGSGVRGWIVFHNRWGPKVALWNDPFFLGQLRVSVLIYLFMVLLYGGLYWWIFVSVQGGGKTTFHRSARSMQVGRQLYQVQSVFVRRQPYLMRPIFLVSFRTDEVKKPWPPYRSLFYNFRQPQNARHLAEEVAAFLGVPVRE